MGVRCWLRFWPTNWNLSGSATQLTHQLVLDSGKTPVGGLLPGALTSLGQPMPLPKDTVGCLTNVSLGVVFHRRYHQHSCFPSLIAHVETMSRVQHRRG